MMSTRFAVAVAAFSVLAGSALASVNVVGSWKGRLTFDFSKLPAQQKQAMQQQSAMVAKMTFELKLNKGGTFTFSMAGVPRPAGAPAQKPQTGTWTLKGNQLSITGDTAKGHAQLFTVAKDGKSFAAAQMNGASIKFTR